MKKENRAAAQERRAKEQQRRKNARVLRIVAIVLAACIAAAAIFLPTIYYFDSITKWAKKTDTSYSTYLEANGTIKGYDDLGSVQLCDYRNISVDYSAIAPTDEAIEAEITAVLQANEYIDTDTARTVADGDKVNIDYKGYAAETGEQFEDTEGNGTQLTIGSGTYIDGFEEQLIGVQVGSTVTVTVVFPAEYPNMPEIAGKPAYFDVVVNGVYQIPELTDEFVAEKLSDYAAGVEEYRAFLYDLLWQENLNGYVEQYMFDNSTVTRMDRGYVNYLKRRTEQVLASEFEYYNQVYYYYTGSYVYQTVYDYIASAYGVDRAGVPAYIAEKAADEAKYYSVFMAAYLAEGLQATQEDVISAFNARGYSGTYDDIVTNYGAEYATRVASAKVVVDFIAPLVTVTNAPAQ